MKSAIEQIPAFQGREILTCLQNGEWYVAIKPICDALDIEYQPQLDHINQDSLLKAVLTQKTMADNHNQAHQMVCLPEKFIYGWLFFMPSDSNALLEFRRTCFEVLANS